MTRDDIARDGAADTALRHITVVGVNRPHLFGFNGMDEDSIRIRTLLDYLDRSGVVIAPDFVIDPVDFMMGRDFLHEQGQTDLVFVSCILKTSRKRIDDAAHLARIGEAARRDPGLAFDLSTRLSDRQSAAAWQSRIAQSGAKLCVTFGGMDEVDTGYVAGPGYRVLVDTPQRAIPLWRDRTETAAAFYGQEGSDLPMLWLGIAAQTDWLATRVSQNATQSPQQAARQSTHLSALLKAAAPAVSPVPAPLFGGRQARKVPFGRRGTPPQFTPKG